MNKGFLGGLFDFSFQSLITGKVIRWIYGLSVGMAALSALAVLSAVTWVSNVLVGLIAGAVVFLGIVVYARVALELAVVLFKIEENTRARERV